MNYHPFSKISDTGKRALYVPFLLMLIAMIPVFKSSIEWVDSKIFDLYFSFSPYIFASSNNNISHEKSVSEENLVSKEGLVSTDTSVSGKISSSEKKANDPPVEIILLDRMFSQRFNREHNRKDFARLLQLLEQGGATVAGIDFLFEDAGQANEDANYEKSLRQFPFPLLAHRFISRGSGALQKFSAIDRSAGRPPWPVSLFSPFRKAAADTGLINLVSDYDSTVRYAPLAFHPEDGEEFIPSLGYSAWIASMISDVSENIINAAGQDMGSDRDGIRSVLNALMKKAPYSYVSTGHDGLDVMTRNMEEAYLLRLLSAHFGWSLDSDNTPTGMIKNSFSNWPVHNTWLTMPEDGLPWAGDKNMPYLRLPFEKLPPPLKSDGIPRRSISMILDTEAERITPRLLARDMVSLKKGFVENVQISSPLVRNDLHNGFTITGQAVFHDNTPVSDAEVLLFMRELGYWDRTVTDEDGIYSLIGVPEGSFQIHISSKSEKSSESLILRSFIGGKVSTESEDSSKQNNLQTDKKIQTDKNLQNDKNLQTKNAKTKNMPLLVLSKTVHSVYLKNITSGELVLTGEPLPILQADSRGSLNFDSLASGLSLWDLQYGSELKLEDSIVKGPDGHVLPSAIAAAMDDNDRWSHTFYYRKNLEDLNKKPENFNNSSAIPLLIEGIPTTINCRAMLVKESDDMNIPGNIAVMPGDEFLIDLSTISSDPSSESTTANSLNQSDSSLNTGINFNCDQSDVKITLFDENGYFLESRRIDDYENVDHVDHVDRKSNEYYKDFPPGNYLLLTSRNNKKGVYKPDIKFPETVFIGTDLPEHHDYVVTPINFMDRSFPRMAGVHIHANLFSALKRNEFLNPMLFHYDIWPQSWPFWQFALILPIVLMLNRTFVNYGAAVGGVSTAVLMISWFAASFLLFHVNRLLPVAYPSMLIGSFGVTRGFVSWIIARRKQEEARQTFSRFISKDVVGKILRSPEALKLGGEKKELTVMFTDLAGFTTMSEQLPPEQLTSLMNTYLDEMTNILFAHGGTLDKYIGDAIMAFWNHPEPQEDHSARGIKCAIEMNRRLAELRSKWVAEGLPEVRMRIGLNRAQCMVGFIGSKVQMNFTCLGDGVNLAARLEGANKLYSSSILVSESVVNGFEDDAISIRFVDLLAVKGKKQPVKVYEIRGYLKDEAEHWADASESFKKGMELYLKRNFEEAKKAMQNVLELIPDDGPAEVYIKRCDEYMKTPPGADWDGRFISNSK